MDEVYKNLFFFPSRGLYYHENLPLKDGMGVTTDWFGSEKGDKVGSEKGPIVVQRKSSLVLTRRESRGVESKLWSPICTKEGGVTSTFSGPIPVFRNYPECGYRPPLRSMVPFLFTLPLLCVCYLWKFVGPTFYT